MEGRIKTIGIIMHGVTGRMGQNQHLIRSVLAIREQGGVILSDGSRVIPDIIIVGRNEEKLRTLAETYQITRFTTDLDEALGNPDDAIFFDAASTKLRPELLRKAITCGKHVYCEKPLAESLPEALDIAEFAAQKGIKNGIVHDKLDLPGLVKLKRLKDQGFFGQILSVRGEFGYWVFDGNIQPAQRPSWNYRAEDGGGMVSDMLCHWRYVLDNIIAPVKSVCCYTATHVKQRWDETGKPYQATADDAAYAMFELEGGIFAQINSSWCVRVHRDDLAVFQVDGTKGSAIAGLHRCICQTHSTTPKAVWNPDEASKTDYYKQWVEVPDNTDFDNGFKVQWEEFIRHVIEDTPWKYSFIEGAKGVQLAEIGYQSSQERRWLDVPNLGGKL